MLTKRTIRNPAKKVGRITAEVVANYVRAIEIMGDQSSEQEFSDLCDLLYIQLGQSPWQYSVFDYDFDAEPPDSVKRYGVFRIKDWQRARALVRELDKAAGFSA